MTAWIRFALKLADMDTSLNSVEIRLKRDPEAEVDAQDFEAAAITLNRTLPPGSVLLRNHCFGVNAGMRSRLGASPATAGTRVAKAYGARLRPGDVPQSDAVAQVMASAASDWVAGDWAVHIAPWRGRDVLEASQLRHISLAPNEPPEDYLTVLGHTAFTAWVGMTVVGQVCADDTVLVSAAAGGVGGYACEIARNRGARVIGSAGSDAKLAYLRDELGVAGAFDYKQQRSDEALAELAPDGLTLYFDTVGGASLEAAIDAMCPHGRIVLCGMVAQTSGQAPEGAPRNLHRMIQACLTMRGFTVLEYEDHREAFEADMREWLRAGRIHSRTTRRQGLKALPQAFADQLRGANIGRMIVQTGDS